jgi:hypothetical protein
VIDTTIAELLAFFDGADGEYAVAVKLRLLREIAAEASMAAQYKAECERLAAQLAASRAAA